MASLEHQLEPGDRAKVKLENTEGNPRTPAYIRGKTGVVVSLHGRIANPTDHRGIYPPLCTLLFDVADVFGGDRQDKLYVDLHEDWLDRVVSG